MAVLSSECCDHNEDDDRENNAYDDTKSRWYNSLRKGTPIRSKQDEDKKTKKPYWNPSFKQNSPRMRSSSEGGSLRTQRKRSRTNSASARPRSRSKSPGLFGSTFASRARQREAIIGTPLVRSRASSVSSQAADITRSRSRSLSAGRFKHQSASPARIIPQKSDFSKAKQKPEVIIIPIRLSPTATAPRNENIQIPIKISREDPIQKQPDRKENYSVPVTVTHDPISMPWSDRYMFQPIGDSLGRSNIISSATQAYKGSLYQQQSKDSYSNKNSQSKSMDEASRNTVNNLNSNSVDVHNNSIDDNNSGDRDKKERISDVYLGKRKCAYSSSYASSMDKTFLDDVTKAFEFDNSDISRYQNKTDNKSSHIRGPLPLWLAPNDLPQEESIYKSSSIKQEQRGENMIKRSSSASSKKSVSDIHIA